MLLVCSAYLETRNRIGTRLISIVSQPIVFVIVFIFVFGLVDLVWFGRFGLVW